MARFRGAMQWRPGCSSRFWFTLCPVLMSSFICDRFPFVAASQSDAFPSSFDAMTHVLQSRNEVPPRQIQGLPNGASRTEFFLHREHAHSPTSESSRSDSARAWAWYGVSLPFFSLLDRRAHEGNQFYCGPSSLPGPCDCNLYGAQRRAVQCKIGLQGRMQHVVSLQMPFELRARCAV